MEFFPCKAKLSDGSVQDIDRDTTVRLDVEFADVDPQELESMKEKAVGKLVERIGKVLFGVQNKRYLCNVSITIMVNM